jgi:hypothetical protein
MWWPIGCAKGVMRNRSALSARAAPAMNMLNRLLNEMDGLKENTDLLFVLTTKRSGRVD